MSSSGHGYQKLDDESSWDQDHEEASGQHVLGVHHHLWEQLKIHVFEQFIHTLVILQWLQNTRC